MNSRATDSLEVAGSDRARLLRTGLRAITARAVAAICGNEFLDDHDKRDLVEDVSSTYLSSGTPTLRAAYRLGRGGNDDTTDDEQKALHSIQAAADAAIRAQFSLIGRALLQVAADAVIENGALSTLIRAARAALNRIVAAEVMGAVNLGRAHALAREHGPDVLVQKRLSPNACPTCRAVHTNVDGTPRILRLSSLRPARRIQLVSRTTAETTIGPAHPGCLCVLEGVIEAGKAPSKSIDPVALAREIELYKAGVEPSSKIDFQGLSIVVENAPGTIRHWQTSTGRSGETRFLYAYGYIEGTVGGENEELDVFVGPDPRSPYVFIVHQNNMREGAEGNWEEDKVMLGFSDIHTATRAYLAHYDDPRFLGSISMMTIEDFCDRLPQSGQHVGAMDVAAESPPLVRADVPELIIVETPDLLKNFARDITLTSPMGTQFEDRGVQTGGGGPSLAVVTPVHVSQAPDARKVGYKEFMNETAREKARWTIRLDPTVLFVRQDGERPVHPITESDVVRLASDLDPDFMREVHEFIAEQAEMRTRAQALSPNIDQPKPVDFDTEKAEHIHVDQIAGGRADNRSPSEFDPEQLATGTEHEKEHTQDDEIAEEIAMDHLAEDPVYYDKLARIEHD